MTRDEAATLGLQLHRGHRALPDATEPDSSYAHACPTCAHVHLTSTHGAQGDVARILARGRTRKLPVNRVVLTPQDEDGT